jgi:hypothetical protein
LFGKRANALNGVRDAGLDEGVHPARNNQLIEKYHTGRLADGEAPGCMASAEPERPRQPRHGPRLEQLVFCGRSRCRRKHRVPAAVSCRSIGWLARAGGKRHRKADRERGDARRSAPPGTG